MLEQSTCFFCAHEAMMTASRLKCWRLLSRWIFDGWYLEMIFAQRSQGSLHYETGEVFWCSVARCAALLLRCGLGWSEGLQCTYSTLANTRHQLSSQHHICGAIYLTSTQNTATCMIIIISKLESKNLYLLSSTVSTISIMVLGEDDLWPPCP